MSKIYYVTKYALSNDGAIQEAERLYENREPDEKYIRSKGFCNSMRLGSEVFETRAEAEADVQRRIVKKIASLRKQISKLEKLATPISSEKEGATTVNSFGYDPTGPEAGAGFRDSEESSNG